MHPIVTRREGAEVRRLSRIRSGARSCAWARDGYRGHGRGCATAEEQCNRTACAGHRTQNTRVCICIFHPPHCGDCTQIRYSSSGTDSCEEWRRWGRRSRTEAALDASELWRTRPVPLSQSVLERRGWTRQAIPFRYASHSWWATAGDRGGSGVLRRRAEQPLYSGTRER